MAEWGRRRRLGRVEVVDYPGDWPHAGYHEIVRPKERYEVVDRDAVCDVLEMSRL